MHQNLRKMSYLDVAIFFCLMATFMVNNCETKSENSSKAANLSKFLSELDLSIVEASIENEESMRKIVKRLAPEKNGEYQIYQVFFGNADLLKEWLKGAGVTGQPGVDFPALTTIPITSFSCRGLKGGYYADLETNCQVFHICDNGRKISFLCPNGTIFQQSQLICDWWFKVDCSKSTELYEQSSEQLFEEQRRRAESRKSKVDYQRPNESVGQQDYYDVQSLNYDGKQNGRIKPYEEAPQENQLQPNRERVKPSRHFEPGNNFNQESNRDSNQLFGGNGGFQSNQSPNVKQQFNQFTRNTEEGSVNRYSTVGQDYYSTSKKSQNYHATNRNVNTLRDEKGTLKRSKFKGSTRNNSTSTTSQRVTPTYTESTTFRASNSSPIKESQQFAESAAFVGNRGNRFNENSNHQYYYQLYVNRDATTRNPNYDSTSPTTWRQNNDNDISTQRNDFIPYTDTTSPFYETTTQYTVTTGTPPCNDEITTESPGPTNSWTNFDSQPTTESLQFANSNYEYRGQVKNAASVRNSFTEQSSYSNSNNNQATNRATNANSNSETIPPTTRSTASTHRPTTATPDFNDQRRTTSYFSPTPTVSFRSNNFGAITDRPVTRNSIDNQSNKYYGDSKDTDKHASTVSSGYRPNLISTTTEKPSRTTSAFQQGSPTEKDLSPYDRSFTYKQGKVMSTLGPYVPFTRNYAHSTASTTVKPTPYTPTVPTTYTTVRSSSKTLSPKLKYPAPTSLSKIKSKSVRFSEREHALSMLHSLRNLESSVPSLSEGPNGSHRAYNVSAAPAPSTLHSLALYFSTATENFDSNEATDSSLSVESAEDVEESMLSKKSNGTVEVPTSLLTRHTIDSYAELFKLNDAVETGNATTEDRVDDASIYGEDYNEDLELQQSGGSLDDLRKSNSTRLRELAQVFTHALSAYLLDPDAFKKVLTEIRPTEPSPTTVESEQWTTTTSYPIIVEDNALTNREKDEVLDFSDDGNNGRQKLTTIYPTTFETPTTTRDSVYDIFSTVPSTYYSTRTSTGDASELSTNYVSFNPVTSSRFDASVPSTASVYTVEQSSTPYANDASGFYGQNNEIDKGNSKVPTTDSYVPSGESGNRNRVGGFQNNSVTIITEPYGNEKLSITTPLSDNYIVSPTPSSPSVFVHMVTYNWNRKSTSKKPEQQLSPPFYENYPERSRKSNEETPGYLDPESYSSTPMSAHSVRSTTLDSSRSHEIPTDQPRKVPRNKPPSLDSKRSGISSPVSKNSYVKFRNLYNRVDEHNIGTTERPTTTTSTASEATTSTTDVTDATPCADINSNDYVESTNQKEELTVSNNDHWTSSPAVTRLWETSVFVDPRKINHGLEGDLGTTISERLEYGNTPSSNEDRFGSSEEYIGDEGIPASAQRLSRDKDSPTTFSLLPTSFVAEESATPKPLITTRSSITTTITSSVTSTNSLPQETLVTSLLPNAIATADKSNDTENEIAEKLFGKLNVSSTNVLMKVMKQADSNETVRQLVLLLIRHCNDPANRTMQQEKDELLNALLRLPVNEFSSGESRSVVAGINQANLPAGGSVGSTRSVPVASVVTEPPVTTFRSRKSRKFRTTTEHSANIVRRSEKGVASNGIKSLQEGETFASDNRALELLRSLYTIATKWG